LKQQLILKNDRLFYLFYRYPKYKTAALLLF
jgi:hypothetical protein